MKQRKMSKKVKFETLLKGKGISPYILAKQLNIAPQSVYRYIWGEREPSVAILVKLTKILNVSGDEILEMFMEESTEMKEKNTPKECVV